MKYVFLTLSWIIAIILFSILVLSIFSGHYLPSFLMLVITTLLIPPLRERLSDTPGIPLPWWMRNILIPMFFILFVFFIFKNMGNPTPISKSRDNEKKLMTICENRMAQISAKVD